MLFAETSVGGIAFIAVFHMTDAFVLRERSIAYGYSMASEVRPGVIQLAVLRFLTSLVLKGRRVQKTSWVYISSWPGTCR